MVYRVKMALSGTSVALGDFTSEAMAKQAVRSVAAALAGAKEPVIVAMKTRDGDLFAVNSDAFA